MDDAHDVEGTMTQADGMGVVVTGTLAYVVDG